MGSEIGMIFAGAAVVVGLVDSVSAARGWTLVTEDSSIPTLRKLREVSSNFGWAPRCFRGLAKLACNVFHKSRCFCAVQLIAVDAAARFCAKTFDLTVISQWITM